MLSNATIADSLSPRDLADLAQSFGLDVSPLDYVEGEFLSDEYLERYLGTVTSQHLWEAAWRFGIVVDNDAPMTGLYGYYHPEDDSYPGSYYVPDDFDTMVSVITLDGPTRSMT